MMKLFTLVLTTSLAASTMALSQGSSAAAPKASEAMPDKPPRSAACTVAKAMLCKSDATCTPATTIGEIKLPMKVTIDFQNRVLMSVDNDGFPVASPIAGLVGGNKQVVLQGIDRGVGWTMHGSASDLKVSFAMTSHETVLSAFGTCEIEHED